MYVCVFAHSFSLDEKLISTLLIIILESFIVGAAVVFVFESLHTVCMTMLIGLCVAFTFGLSLAV